jgi:hypothetical protein
MIWFFTPYSFEMKLFGAYDLYMSLIVNHEDWVVLMDGDTLFFQPNFGHLLKDYIDRYPNTGMFVCFTNRIGCREQQFSNDLSAVDSLQVHYKTADFLYNNHHGEVTELHAPISGFMMVLQKKTWNIIKKELRERTKKNFLLRVDREIASVLLEKGMSIRRMDGLFMLHYYRMIEGTADKRGIK